MIDSQIYIKIIRYLDGDPDEGLHSEIMDWRFNREENERFFQHVEFLWNTSAELKDLEYLDSESSLLRLSEKLGYSMERPGLWRRFRALAVACVLLLTIGAWFYSEMYDASYLTLNTGSLTDSVALADGSMIYLGANSSFRYPEKMDSRYREVYLLKGTAFFKIFRNPARPFVVNVDSGKVTVLGTSFNISTSSRRISLGVRTGKVRFEAPGGNQSSLLTVGDHLTYDRLNHKILLDRDKSGLAYAWLTRELVFEDTGLKDVFNTLAAYYQVSFDLRFPLNSMSKFNATFKNNTLAEVLDILDETYGLSSSREGDHVVIIKKK